MKLRSTESRQMVQISVLSISLLSSGCTSMRLETARNQYSTGEYAKSIETLTPAPKDNTDKVLFLMERGMARQMVSDYRGSVQDWLEAAKTAEALDLYSLTGDTPSLLINDSVMPFRGAPYERALLRTYAAQSYMALKEWEDAAVEARNIVYMLENRDGFPDDPYSRYLAGLSFEINGDSESAAFQYRQISNSVNNAVITDSGIIQSSASISGGKNVPGGHHELVCLIGLGTMRNAWGDEPSHVEICDGSQTLGRSCKFTDIGLLWEATRAKLELRRGAKSLLRLALKEWLIHEMGKKDKDAAAALSTLLYGLEMEDIRRWETLPRWLHIARIRVPANLNKFRLVARDASGQILEEQLLDSVVVKEGHIKLGICRMQGPGFGGSAVQVKY